MPWENITNAKKRMRWCDLICYACLLYAVEAASMEAPLKLSKLSNSDPFYTLDVLFNGKSLSTIIDTGSTGLVVANENAIRKTTSCKTSPTPCSFQSEWKLNYVLCYTDGAGYFVQPAVSTDTRESISFGSVPVTKVTFGRGVGVFDPEGSMLTGNSQVFVSIFGFGTHGDRDCSFSTKDALTDILNTHSLPNIWSLRSVTATGAGRLYLGTSASAFHISESTQYTGMVQYAGRYSVVLSGLLVSSIGIRSKSSKERFTALECVLDTGSSATLISSAEVMKAILNFFGALACQNGQSGWSASTATTFGDYTQHSCRAAVKWDSHTITFLFNDGGRSAALPVDNFFTVSNVGGEIFLHLLILSTAKPNRPNVLGKQFFANQWVEFDRSSKLRIGFAVATSAKDTWGPWGKCPCGDDGTTTQTRSCVDNDGDGEFCAGRSYRPCKSKPCPTTTTTKPTTWSPWGLCSKPCGQGTTTRTCLQGECVGPSERNCQVSICCPQTCDAGYASKKSCDHVYQLRRLLGKSVDNLCSLLEEAGCDCKGCKTCAAAVASCRKPQLVIGEDLEQCNCPHGRLGKPTWTGVAWDASSCHINSICPSLSVDHGGTVTYSDGLYSSGQQHYGSVASISCPEGYKATGGQRTCGEDNKWTGGPQSCESIANIRDIHGLRTAIRDCIREDNTGKCPKLGYGPIANWDVSRVVSMFGIFKYLRNFDADLSNWDVSRVYNMDSMFRDASSFNGDISKWNVSYVKTMKEMFYGAGAFYRDISQWNVSQVGTMYGMFTQTSFNGDISKWDVSRVTDMSHMFEAASFNGDISKWDVSKVTNFDSMFARSGFSRMLCGSWKKNKNANSYSMFMKSQGKMCGQYLESTN